MKIENMSARQLTAALEYVGRVRYFGSNNMAIRSQEPSDAELLALKTEQERRNCEPSVGTWALLHEGATIRAGDEFVWEGEWRRASSVGASWTPLSGPNGYLPMRRRIAWDPGDGWQAVLPGEKLRNEDEYRPNPSTPWEPLCRADGTLDHPLMVRRRQVPIDGIVGAVGPESMIVSARPSVREESFGGYLPLKVPPKLFEDMQRESRPQKQKTMLGVIQMRVPGAREIPFNEAMGVDLLVAIDGSVVRLGDTIVSSPSRILDGA